MNQTSKQSKKSILIFSVIITFVSLILILLFLINSNQSQLQQAKHDKNKIFVLQPGSNRAEEVQNTAFQKFLTNNTALALNPTNDSVPKVQQMPIANRFEHFQSDRYGNRRYSLIIINQLNRPLKIMVKVFVEPNKTHWSLSYVNIAAKELDDYDTNAFGVFSVTLDANRDEPSMYPNNSWSLWGLYGGDRIEITSEEYAPVSLNPP